MTVFMGGENTESSYSPGAGNFYRLSTRGYRIQPGPHHRKGPVQAGNNYAAIIS